MDAHADSSANAKGLWYTLIASARALHEIGSLEASTLASLEALALAAGVPTVPPPSEGRREFGLLRALGTVGPAFADPLPDSEIDEWEGGNGDTCLMTTYSEASAFVAKRTPVCYFGEWSCR